MRKYSFVLLILLGIGVFLFPFHNTGAMAATPAQGTGQNSTLSSMLQALQAQTANNKSSNPNAAALDEKIKQLQQQINAKPTDTATTPPTGTTPKAEAAATTPAATPGATPALDQAQINQLAAAQQAANQQVATAAQSTQKTSSRWQLLLLSVMYLVTIFLTWLFLFYGVLTMRAWMVSIKRMR